MAWRKKDKYNPEDEIERSFTAFIILGNRQIARREVTATRRFKVFDNSYCILPECIFLKNVDGQLRSVSYYREGNPRPFSFQQINEGLTPKELDKFYSEDFFSIVTSLQPQNRMKYILAVVIVNFVLAISFTIIVALRVFVWK